MIHQDDQFPHDGREGDFGGFARRDQPVIKRLEQVIVPAGRQCRHVKSPAHFWASAADGAFAGPLAAVAVVGTEASQGGGLAPVEGSQFGHSGQPHHGGEATHAGDVIEPLHLAGQRRLGLQEGFQESFNFGDLFSHLGQPGGEEFAQIQIGAGVSALGFGDPQFEQLRPPRDQGGHFELDGRAWRRGCRREGLAKGGEPGGVNRIGFGEFSGGAGELADAGRIEDADRNGSGVERGGTRPFITAGGFTDDLDAGERSEAFDQLGVARGGVGQIVGFALEVKLERGFGNVKTGIDGGFFVVHNTVVF